MLIREDVGTELVIATRLLAHAGALGPNDRLSVLAGEVIYVNSRSAGNRTMTAHDMAAVWLVDGYVLRGEPPEAIGTLLDEYRAHPHAPSIALVGDRLVRAASLRECAVALLRERRPELKEFPAQALWDRAEAEAKSAGAFVGI